MALLSLCLVMTDSNLVFLECSWLFLFFCIIVLGLPFSKGTAEVTTIELHPILVEYAEYGASTLKAAYRIYVIKRMPIIVHAYNHILTFRFLLCGKRFELCGFHMLLQILYMSFGTTQYHNFFR